MDNREWFRQNQFGMMVHWGLYSLLGGEWKGRRTPYLGEWMQAYEEISIAAYEKLAAAFNPVLFSAEDWVLLAKEAGMRYLVVTAKHHDGFALFHSKADPFNVVDAAPFGRDIMAELAEACQKHGLKLGLYYSQDLDWHEPDGGGYTMGHTNCGGCSWTNDWDFPNEGKEYGRCFERKIKPQVRELLTGYGDLLLIWFDVPCTISPEQSRELFDMVKHYQPNCLVNSRIGNGLGDYRSLEDNEIPEAPLPDGLYESPVTMNDTFGFRYNDDNWKSAETLLALKEKLNRNRANFLLNVGPDHLGRIPAPAQQILQEMGRGRNN